MNTKKLKSVLTDAVDKFSDLTEDQREELFNWPAELPAELTELDNCLRSASKLELFDNKMRQLGSTGSIVTYDGLAKWLVYRSINVGVEQATKDLVTYVHEPEYKYYQVRILSGIKIEKELQLANGIRLVKFSDLPESVHKKEFLSNLHVSYPDPPFVALLRESKHARIHLNQEENMLEVDDQNDWMEDFLDASDSLVVIACKPILSDATWSTISESVPLGGLFYSSGYFVSTHIKRINVPKEFHPKKYNKVKRIYESYIKISETDKEVLRIAISRLNTAMEEHPRIDSAIDLRVAMENVFLKKDERGEYGYKIRVRAARCLRKNPQDRKDLYELFKNLYNMGSNAVHTGKFKKKDSSDFLKDGFRYVSEAIEKIILNKGFPDWDDIVLSK